MRVTNSFLAILLIILSVAYAQKSLAYIPKQQHFLLAASETDKDADKATSPEKQLWPIDAELAEFAEQRITAHREHRAIEANIPSALTEKSAQFNLAETLVYAVMHAVDEFSHQQYQAVIDRLTAVEPLLEQVDQRQSEEVIFHYLHFLLAKSYAGLGQFEQAFEQQKSYVTKFRAYRRWFKKKTVADLNQKYQTDKKQQENVLLTQQNKLEAIKIRQVNAEQRVNQQLLFLLVCTAIVVILLIVRQYRIRRTLHLISQMDTLTDCYNRRTLFERAEQLLASADGEHFSLILFDVDHFKQINDRYGHHVGDQILIKVADLGKEVMRARDIFARIGGEEFVAILPQTGLDEAKAIAERLREKIAESEVVAGILSSQLTASFGVACIDQVEKDFDHLLHAADTAMYTAKATGRNCVVVYQ